MSDKNRREFLLASLAPVPGLLFGTARSKRTPSPSPAPPRFEDIRKIDVHSHIFEDMPVLAQMLVKNNLQIINVCNRGNDPVLLRNQDQIVQEIFQKYGASVFAFASSFDLMQRNEPNYAEQVIAWLDRNFRAGAVMVKIWKEVGLDLKTPEGDFLMPDDSVFDPIYDFLADEKKPLLAHLAEPIAAWQPLDPENVHYGYYSNHPEWHFYGKDEYPSHAELIASRDRILQKHPDLIVIGAHMGSLAHDVDEVAQRLDAYPNFYVECSARTADLTRQPPGKVRDFFLQYSDRILYGLDMTRRSSDTRSPEAFVREMEQRYRLDYEYYAGNDWIEYRGKRIRSLALPPDVLERFYHVNAERLMSVSADDSPTTATASGKPEGRAV